MIPNQLHQSIQTIDIPGRRRFLIWGERRREIHLQSVLPASGSTSDHTLCGRESEPDSRVVIAPDTQICRACVERARARALSV